MCLKEFFKSFWKQILLVSLLTGIGLVVISFAENELFGENPFSVIVHFLNLLVLIWPLIPAFIGAYWAAGKTDKRGQVIAVASIGTTSIALISVLLLFAYLFSMTENRWAFELKDVMDYTGDTEITIPQFQFVTFMQTIGQSLNMLLSYFGLGVIGGYLGFKWRKRKKRED